MFCESSKRPEMDNRFTYDYLFVLPLHYKYIDFANFYIHLLDTCTKYRLIYIPTGRVSFIN